MIIHLDFKSDTPIYMQIRNQIVLGIGKGDLSAGENLPSIRQMAQDSGVNVMTVDKAFALLKYEGFISIDRRHGATVNEAREQGGAEKKLENQLELVISEAGLRGIQKNEFYTICDRIFTRMKGIANPA